MTAPKRLITGAAVLALLVGAGAGGFGLARLTTKASPPAPAGRRVLYWYDPMTPTQHFDKPGKSPSMDMPLVPKYADEDGADPETAGVRIDPTTAQNLGLRTTTVRAGTLAGGLVVPGTLAFDQRAVAIVQARAAGFVQKVYQRAPGDVIAAGAPLADILIPDWAGAQAEYLAVRRSGDPALVAAARQRLRLVGMSETMVAAVERDGRPHSIATIVAPIGGAITKLDVRTGMTVVAGQSLAEINGLSRIWVLASIPEAQGSAVRAGSAVRLTLADAPAMTLTGRVQSVLPEVSGETRTLQARIELPNPGGRLRPGMLASVAFDGDRKPALLAPSEAVIRTGRRAIVLLAKPGGRYEAVEVRTGAETGGFTEILAGLSAGQTIVSSGQFLIDSEANLANLAVRPLAAQGPVAPDPDGKKKPPPPLAEASGRIEAIEGAGVTISHGAVAATGWPAMTMTFRADPNQLHGLAAADRVAFAFDQPPQGPTVRRIAKIGDAR